MASASIADEPVTAAAAILVIATSRFPASAVHTTKPEVCAMKSVVGASEGSASVANAAATPLSAVSRTRGPIDGRLADADSALIP